MTSTYEPGQVWRYNNREGEANSRLTIVAIDEHATLGVIVHVYVEGVAIPNPQAPGGATDVITHLPFSEEAIDRSVVERVGDRALPDYLEGYTTWREAFDAGEAGVFTITVGEAVQTVEDGINRGTVVDD